MTDETNGSGVGEREDPTHCWADPIHHEHRWDETRVCNDSGIPLGYRCRWCTREVLEVPVPATPDADDASEKEDNPDEERCEHDVPAYATCEQCATSPAASTEAGEGLSEAERETLLHWLHGGAAGGIQSLWFHVERIVAARESAAATRARAEALREVAEAQRCGGCKGEGSHRRHCPRHPNYHPWIPLADRAEGIGDSLGEPGLANQAWALAGAIRREMPNHPFRPARLRDRA